MSDAVAVIEVIPDVVWAAALGSLLTLLGVFVNSRHNATEQERARKHFSEEREKDRKHELRHSVYLKAAAELTTAQQFLAKLHEIDFAAGNPVQPLDAFFRTINEVCLVATDESVTVINDFMQRYLEAFMDLTLMATPVHELRNQKNIESDLYERYSNEVTRILGEMSRFNEAAQHDANVFRALQAGLNHNQAMAAERLERRTEAWDELNRQTVAYLRGAMPRLQQVFKDLVPALVAIRKELDISSDIQAYSEQFERRADMVNEQLGRFLDTIEQDQT